MTLRESLRESALRGLSDLRSPGRRTGLFTALGAGASVAAAVARFFIQGTHNENMTAIAAGTALVAFVATTAGTFLAVRATTTGKAVLWVFVSHVIPPTGLCAPTVIGIFFAVPAGLLAFVLVLPLALLSRRSAASDRPGHGERDAIFGAGFSLLFAIALGPWVSELRALGLTSTAPFLAWALAIVATGLSSGVLLRSVLRASLLRAIAAGRERGYRLGSVEEGAQLVEREADAGAGPLRSGTTRDVVAGFVPALARTLTTAAIAALAVLAMMRWALSA